jgi:hypothetical protein
MSHPRMAGLVLALSMLANPSQAATVFNNGNQLLEDCQSDNKYFVVDCDGYITGIADTLGNNAINEMTACVPNTATRKQVEDVVVGWLISNPGARHFAAPGLVAAALSETFPC